MRNNPCSNVQGLCFFILDHSILDRRWEVPEECSGMSLIAVKLNQISGWVTCRSDPCAKFGCVMQFLYQFNIFAS
jgi:hypothetical protein